MIRDRIFCGVNNADIQKTLLSVSNTLTLDQTLKTATSIETASKNAEIVHGSSRTPIHQVDTKERSCHRCDQNHDPNWCFYKTKECFYCKNIGHTAKMCRKKKEKAKEEKSAGCSSTGSNSKQWVNSLRQTRL